MPKPQLLVLNSTNVVRLYQLRNEIDEMYQTDATVTLDLVDAIGTIVAGASNLPMTFVEGAHPTENEYRATLSHTLSLTENAIYDARVTAIASDGSRRVFHLPCRAVA